MRPLLLLYPQSSSGSFRLSTSTHTAQRIASSAISFRLPSASISAAASFRLTPVFHFRFRLSLGRPFHFLSSASFPLSDPRCFSFLSSASVLDSDYSAFCSSFPSLPGSASQLLPRCPSPLSLPRLPLSLQPDFSCLPSRFLYLASLFVSFRSSLLRSHSRSTGAYLPFSLPAFSTSDSLPFVRSSSASSYSAFCSSFPSLPGFASQLLSRCPSPLSLPRFPLSLRPDFSCLPSRFLYLASLMVSFRPSLIRSRSCSSGAYLVLSLSVFSLPFRFLSSASLPVLATQPLFLPFLFLPVSPSQWVFFGASLLLSLLWFSPFSPTWFPMPSFPALRTQLPVCFLSPFPDSLPQLFLRCFPHALAFGLFPFLPLPFVCFRSGSGYLASVSSFPLSSRFPLTVGLLRCSLSALASLVFPVLPDLISHVLFPGSSYSASCSFPFALP